MIKSSWDYIILGTMRKDEKQNKIKRLEKFKHNIDSTSNLKFRENVELVDRAGMEK